MASEQIDPGHQGQGAVAFVLVITPHGRADARQRRTIRRGRTDRLDPGFLAVRDDGKAAARVAVLTLCPVLTQHRHMPGDTEDFGHLRGHLR
jgi:hypothetical protein